jgi:hypothetical protein
MPKQAPYLPIFLEYGYDAAEQSGDVLATADIPDALTLDLDVAALLGPAASAPSLKIERNEPAPDPESVDQFASDILQQASRMPPISLSHLTRNDVFDALEVRQGFLLNCPLAAVLVAMAHVDENRTRAEKRLPRMVRSDFRHLRPITTRRPTLLTEEQNFLDAEAVAGRDTKIPQSFRSDILFHCSFFRRSTAIVVTNVLYWQTDWSRLLYCWAKTGALWPSAIEKAYIYELGRERDYLQITSEVSRKLTALRNRNNGFPDAPPLDDVALEDERSAFLAAGRYPAYRDLESLSGVLVMTDLLGICTEYDVAALTDNQLDILLGRHATKATILGVRDDSELAPGDPTPLSLTANHYVAVTNHDSSNGETTVVDAQGTGPDLTGDDIAVISRAVLRHDIGEIVQEL